MDILRACHPQDRNVYYVCVNSVKTTSNGKEAAHYLSYKASHAAAYHLSNTGPTYSPYVPIIAMADFYLLKPGDKDMDELYVLQNTDDQTYFVSASYDGGIETTENINEAAHYLSEASAEDAKSSLEGFEHTYFEVEPHGFWSEE